MEKNYANNYFYLSVSGKTETQVEKCMDAIGIMLLFMDYQLGIKKILNLFWFKFDTDFDVSLVLIRI